MREPHGIKSHVSQQNIYTQTFLLQPTHLYSEREREKKRKEEKKERKKRKRKRELGKSNFLPLEAQVQILREVYTLKHMNLCICIV